MAVVSSITEPMAKQGAPSISGGGQVQPCREADIPEVAELHAQVFYQGAYSASEELRAYYRQVFFENPWREDDLPSWIFRSPGGRVVGFLGVIPRRMIFNGKAVRVAVAHRLMVAPDSRSPFAAIRLVRALFSGPQDLVLSDGANDNGHRFWTGLGGSAVLLYSLNWIRPLRPAGLLWSALRRKHCGMLFPALLHPLCHVVDSAASRIPGASLRPQRPVTTAQQLDASELLECISRFSLGCALRPRYDLQSLRWLLDRMAENRHRGELEGLLISNRAGECVGACLYYLRRSEASEVVLLAARKDAHDAVLKQVLRDAWENGAAALQGRFEPEFYKAFMDNRCALKRGCWALVHSRNPELIGSLHRGDAFLTALEGELWLRAPGDKL